MRGDMTLYMESLICRRWGCTPTELGLVPAWRVELEMAFIAEENAAERARG